MKPGDLYRIKMDSTCPWRGKFAMIIGEQIREAGDSRYIKCFCEGIRMIPLHWLEDLDDPR